MQRFEISILSINNSKTTYIATTWFGEQKAIAMAVSRHVSIPKHHAIYKIMVHCLENAKLADTDLVDRLEW